MTDPPMPFSLKRYRLCSRAHAARIAWRLCDQHAQPVHVVRTGDCLQPYRVTTETPRAGEAVELAVDL